MMHRRTRIPKYRLHRSTSRAVVRIGGKDIYLGRHNSAESREKYDRLIAEWLANGRVAISSRDKRSTSITVNEIVASYWCHVKRYYVDPDGAPTAEQNTIQNALRPLTRLYGSIPAVVFGHRCLATVRDAMVRQGWARRHINKQITRIRSMFRWAAANEWIPATVPQALAVLAPLKKGRTSARETKKVRPVSYADMHAIREYVSPQVWALARLQWLTGARAGELVRMKVSDLDRTGSVWIARLDRHKTAHHGKRRTLYFGPRAQRVLQRFLADRDDDAFLFSPRQAERHRHDQSPTHRRPDRMPNSKKTAREVGECYSTSSYRRAIHRACDKAHIEKWSPHRLRHSAATRLRRREGLRATQLILDHQDLVTTLEYAEASEAQALQVMSAAG